MVPGHEPVAVEVDPKQISRILFSETGHNTIFDVEVAGQPAAKAMIVDWQREPIKDQLIHIDLKRIALDKVLRVSVRVKLLGIPVGVKAEGGILDQVLREVEIECLPADIPSHIDVDVSGLGMHDVLRVSGLPHSDKIKYLNCRGCNRGPRGLDPRRSGCARRRWKRRQRLQRLMRKRHAEPEVAKKGKTGGRGRPAKKPEGRRSKPWPSKRDRFAGGALSWSWGSAIPASSICGRRTMRGSWPLTASPNRRALWCRTGGAGLSRQPAAWRDAR